MHLVEVSSGGLKGGGRAGSRPRLGDQHQSNEV